MRRSRLAIAIASVVMAAPQAGGASDRSEVVAVVQAYNDAGNKGDRAAYGSFCADDAIVVDHVPPYLFKGLGACAKEYDAVVAWATALKIPAAGFSQKVRDPVFFETRGDHAYAVFPVKVSFRESGRSKIERSYLTTVLRRHGQTWRIESLVYSSLGWGPTEEQRR